MRIARALGGRVGQVRGRAAVDVGAQQLAGAGLQAPRRRARVRPPDGLREQRPVRIVVEGKVGCRGAQCDRAGAYDRLGSLDGV